MATLATLPNLGVGGATEIGEMYIDIFIDRCQQLLPSLRRRSKLDCLVRREPITMQRIESRVCEPITDRSRSVGERFVNASDPSCPVLSLVPLI
jgi:hypothetical protein